MSRARVYPKKKSEYYDRVSKLFDEYDRILVVGCDNVQSMQMHRVRIALRGKAVLVMGKNTLLKKIISDRAERKGATQRDKQLVQRFNTEGLLRQNVGIIMVKDDLKEVIEVLDRHKVQAPARAGATSPVEVIVPAGNTGLDPQQTQFFMALNIQTKISKGTVEIIKDVKVLSAGDKVGNSEATLLQKLKINPFFYGLEVRSVYDQGAVYGMEVLQMTEESKHDVVQAAVDNIAALSLAIGYPTEASLPHTVTNAFKDIFAIALGTDLTFSDFGADALKEAIKSGKVAAAAPAGGAAAAPAPAGGKAAAGGKGAASAPAPAPAAAEEEEEGGDMGMGLFD